MTRHEKIGIAYIILIAAIAAMAGLAITVWAVTG